ncbi:MAG TPA: M13 family metallopeptidase [Bryobacteraceae bacterium]|nr:M13 family metallopeptidase [Bryobacteraceae bacterium]
MFKTTLLALLCVGALFAQQPSNRAPADSSNPASSGQPASPASPAASMADIRFDIHALDTSVDPCVDFYQYACGNWIKNNPIPADHSRWGRFSELDERNHQILHEILEQTSKPSPSRKDFEQKIGDYYAACMDEPAINAKGLKPLEPELNRIRALSNKSQLAGEVAHLHRYGMSALFDFGSGQDFKDSNSVIAQADQGGLGLPDRDYYLKTDAKSVELRQKYQAHVERMFVLAGETPEKAKADAATVMKLETALAQGSLDLVSRRDPEKVYHRMDKQQLAALSPQFAWNQYFTDSGAPSFQSVNVAWPDFFKAVNSLVQSESLEDWKTYLTWQVLHSEAPLLPTPFVEENFNFFGKELTGAKEMRPRWKRCVDFTDAQLGEALGREYVERTFGAEGKARTLKMVDAIEKAMGADLQQLPWMTPATKQQALIKLKAITNKIGYPDKWRDYSSVVVKRDDALGNGFRADQFEFERQLAKIGKPVDRTEWAMTPPTVNAYYDPLMNNINFPAGILQPPFFDKTMDDAVNYGAIGMVIGHELTHAFDDEGRQFDAKGNLRDWWTPEDAKAFEQRAACVADEYSKFEVEPGVHVNGKLTLGENTADNGGVRIALMALMDTLAGKPQPKIDGFTPQQRLFLAFGQVWCQNARQQALRLQVQTDPHAPAQFRVNGVVQNMPEFQKAFSCTAKQPMVSSNACRVW